MRMRFIKLSGNRHEIVITERGEGPDLRRPPRETGPTIPHDMAHAVVESALGLNDGFCAAVDGGVMFEDFQLLQPGRNRRAGLKAMRKLGDSAFPAELKVSWAHRVWSGQRTEGRGLGKAPIAERELEIACTALDQARAKWDALGEGDSLEWRWPN